MEIGFYHPSVGYWQTTNEPPASVLASYPQGTVQVPLKPGENYEWDGAWQAVTLPTIVPNVVTMRQARLVLFGAGLLPQVEAAIDALTEPARTAARIEWDYSSEVHRNKPFVQALATAIGLTGAQLDALFIQAAALP